MGRALDGIVEECYRRGDDRPLVYWKANGSEEVFQAHLKRELDNVARFIDGDSTSVIITTSTVSAAGATWTSRNSPVPESDSDKTIGQGFFT